MELQKVTLNIIKGDREILEKWFPTTGWSVAARTVIHKFCNVLRTNDKGEGDVDIQMLIAEGEDDTKVKPKSKGRSERVTRHNNKV